MELTQQQMLTALKFMNNELRANLPYVTGNLRRNTNFYYAQNPNVPNAIIYKISLETDYASFVNYGYERHPNSKKLKRDYRIVERTLKKSMRAIFQSMGARVTIS